MSSALATGSDSASLPTIGVAAVGVGRRLTHLLELLMEQRHPRIKLIAVADEAEPVARSVSELYDVPHFHDLESMLRVFGDQIQWIMVGSINSDHAKHCIAAFNAKKHVFCEKPIAVTIDECEQILAAQQAAGTHFATGFVLRHAPVYERIQQMVSDGKLGRLVSIDANEILYPDHGGYIFRNWRRHQELSGGHLLEKCCHDIDLLNWIVGSVPTRVASFGGRNIFRPENLDVAQRVRAEGERSGRVPQYNGWAAWEDVDPFTSGGSIVDNQVCILEYRNGVRVTFHTNCCAAFPQRRMLVMGLEGTLEADMWSGVIHVQRMARGAAREAVDVSVSGSGHGGGDAFLIADLVHTMTTGAPPRATGKEGMRSAVVCLALEEAMRQGCVVDLEPYWRRFKE